MLGDIQRAYTRLLDDGLEPDDLRNVIDRLKKDRAELDAQIARVSQENSRDAEVELRIIDTASRLIPLYSKMRSVEKRELCKIVLSNSVFEGTTPRPAYKKAFEMLTKMRTEEKWLGN